MHPFNESNFIPDSSPGYLVRLINQMSMAGLERALAGEGLNASQWMAMVSLHFHFADTCAELARQLAHDKGAMTRLIDALEERGWVERTRAEDDRRIVRLALTPEGYEVAMRGRRKVIECWNHWLGDWNESEVEALLAMLRRLRTSMEKAGPCNA
ncbi:MarR family transcriptional regulator [Sphingomonas sp. CL5.1]|uniref:MarR family winged helix-turn-helix transcriptional regulator n=1 Tax=Sphingomonas sp. CL5.1 TaxID=2653203 RepID=UPI00158249FC|nr:MarR family transcriptional regulator [Sphingomonas sp. CL5.1]QKR99462.1 MarR family transcriptional regulator [Sphingomonas sp. CL5.1]